MWTDSFNPNFLASLRIATSSSVLPAFNITVEKCYHEALLPANIIFIQPVSTNCNRYEMNSTCVSLGIIIFQKLHVPLDIHSDPIPPLYPEFDHPTDCIYEPVVEFCVHPKHSVVCQLTVIT